MHNGGKTILLEAGNYKAKIVTVGAGIAELTLKNRHLIIPHIPEEMPPAHMGKVLIPWPNRIANGCYCFNNDEFKLPITEHITQAAIHGFLAWRAWNIDEQTSSSVTLSTDLPPSYGYPFLLHSTALYQLDPNKGLTVTLTTQNIGTEKAPYGVGIHPYLTCNLALINHYSVTVPANQVFAVDPSANPTHLLSVDELNLNFSSNKHLGDTFIDNTFKADKTPWTVSLHSEQQHMSTFMYSNQPWIQVYTGDKLNRIGLAIEPMSCPPNAFNSKIDLVVLKRHEKHEMTLTIGGKIDE